MRPILIALALSLSLPFAAAAETIAVVGESVPETQPIEPQAEAEPEYGPIPVTDQVLADFKWQARLLVVFADTPRDPSFTRQMDLIDDRLGVLEERDVVILTDTDPAAATPLRIALRPRGFALVIVDKDSRVLQRKPSPWDVREITRAIDKTPLRQEELRERREADRRLIGLPPE